MKRDWLSSPIQTQITSDRLFFGIFQHKLSGLPSSASCAYETFVNDDNADLMSSVEGEEEEEEKRVKWSNHMLLETDGYKPKR